MHDIYQKLDANRQLLALSIGLNGHIEKEVLDLLVLREMVSALVSIRLIHLFLEVLHAERVHLLFLHLFLHCFKQLLVVMFAHWVHCLSVDQELYLLTHLHLPPDKLDQHNGIDRVNFLGEESLAQEHDAVETLEGQL